MDPRARCEMTSYVGRVLLDPAGGGSKEQDQPYTSVISQRASIMNRLCASWVVLVVWTAGVAAANAGDDVRLVDAVRKGDNGAVRSLLKARVDVNARQPDGATALAWAANRDDLQTAALLIAAGAK